jgi:hypothetical protein
MLIKVPSFCCIGRTFSFISVTLGLLGPRKGLKWSWALKYRWSRFTYFSNHPGTEFGYQAPWVYEQYRWITTLNAATTLVVDVRQKLLLIMTTGSYIARLPLLYVPPH